MGVECRAGDQATLDRIAVLNDRDATDRILAERTMNRLLQGGCTAPMAGYAELQGDELWLRGLVGSLDGTQVIRAEARGARAQAEDIGREVAQALLERGAGPFTKGLSSRWTVIGSVRQPLQGLNVIVTRPRHQADALLEALASAGAHAISFPTIRIAPRSVTTSPGDDFDAVIFVSVNAVQHGSWVASTRTASAPVIAVGAATAAAPYWNMAWWRKPRPRLTARVLAMPAIQGTARRDARIAGTRRWRTCDAAGRPARTLHRSGHWRRSMAHRCVGGKSPRPRDGSRCWC